MSEMTDEEILAVAGNFGNGYTYRNEDLISFARALLSQESSLSTEAAGIVNQLSAERDEIEISRWDWTQSGMDLSISGDYVEYSDVEKFIGEERAASAAPDDIPQDTLDRLLVGKATEGDQMLVYNALMQSSMEGAVVSVDVSKSEDDAYNRIFARIIDWQEDSDEGRIYLAIEEGRNFTASPTPPTKSEIGEDEDRTIADDIQGDIDSWRGG